MLRAKSNQLSFYGSHIYDWVISDDHFLKLVRTIADLDNGDLIKAHQLAKAIQYSPRQML